MKGVGPRLGALAALASVRTGAPSQLALDRALGGQELAPADASLAGELFYGVLRWQGYLTFALSPHLKRPFKTCDSAVQDLLLLGAYQLLKLRIPDHAALSATVEAARRGGAPRAVGFVNAVLRRVAEAGEPPLPKATEDRLAVEFSHPRWLVARWLERYGSDQTEAWLAFNQQRPPLEMRVNSLRRSRADYISWARGRGVQVDATPLAPFGVRLPRMPLRDVPGFTEGLVAVQSEVSQLVVSAVDPRPEEAIADVCAGLGGKTMALFEWSGGRAHVLAGDAEGSRLEALAAEARRLGHAGIDALKLDARSLPESMRGRYDRVLVDAPCSSLGVIRRHPEIRWRRHPADLPSLSRLQLSVLQGAATAVRPGGTLVYAVCSLEPEEGEAVCRAFAEGEPFESEAWEGAAGGSASFTPFDGLDGFYVHRFRRKVI